MFVIMRSDGAYVAPPGQRSSYVRALQHARVFTDPAQAERERCPGNEVVVPVHEALHHHPR